MIRKLKLGNFEAPGVTEWTFGMVSRVIGPNGAGKSRLSRAAFWALTGLDDTGSAMTERYIAADEPACVVEVTIRVGERDLVIRRKRARTGAHTILVDGVPSSDAEILQLMGMPSADALGCAMLPGGYWHGLTQDDRRAMLIGMLPPTEYEDAYRERLPDGPKLDWSRGVDKLYTETSAARLDAQKTASAAQLQIDALRPLATVDESEAVDAGAVASAKSALDVAQTRHNDAVALAASWDAYQDASIAYSISAPATAEDDAGETPTPIDLGPLGAALDTARRVARVAESELTAQLEVMAKAQASIVELTCRTKCPTCKREWTPNEAEVAELNKKVTDAETRVAAMRKASGEKTDALKQAEAAFDAAEAHNARCRALPNRGPEPVAPKLARPEPEQIEAMRTAFDAASDAYEAIRKKHAAYTARVNAATEAARGISQAEAKLNAAIESIATMSAIESTLHPRTGIEADILKAQVAALDIPGFRVELVDTLKNGKTRPACRLVRTADNLPLEWLSSGERLRGELALSAMLWRLAGVGPDVAVTWVAQRDLLDKLTWTDDKGQNITERVVVGATLAVEVLK